MISLRTTKPEITSRSVTGLLLTISIAINLAQAWRISTFVRAASPTPVIPLAPGTIVDALDVQSMDNKPVRIPVVGTGRTTVLYVFTPTCVWCQRNEPNMRAFVTAAKQKGWQVIGISLLDAGLAEYLAKADLAMPVYHSPSSSTRAAYRLGGTPTTVVVGRDGHILYVWPGAYGGAIKERIEETLGVRLPGIAPTTPGT